MIPGLFGPGRYPPAYVPDEFDDSVPDPFRELLNQSNPEFIYLLEATPFDQTAESTYYSFAPGMAPPSMSQVTLTGAEVNVRLASRTFTTGPTDTPASTIYAGVLESALNISASIRSPGESVGSIRIRNTGDLDALAGYAWDGRMVTVKAGGVNFTYSQFAVVFRGTIDTLLFEQDSLFLAIRDRDLIFDQPIQRAKYAGTGGAEGGTSLTGQWKPVLFGKRLNIEPVLVDQSSLLYQVHDGQMQAIDAVRDKGVAITFDADYASYASLAAASIASGRYATCLEAGVFRLGGTPTGRITVDARGDAAGSYVDTLSTIVRRIASTWMGGYNLADPTSIDAAAFAKVAAVQTGTVGVYVTDDETAGAVMDRLLGSVLGYRYFTRAGLFAIGVRKVPATADVVRTITASMVTNAGISCVDTVRPAYSLKVGYQGLGVVQTGSDISSAADLEFYGREFRYTDPVVSSSVRAKHRQAEDKTVNTALDASADADTEAARQASFYAAERKLIEVPMTSAAMFRYWLGDVVALSPDRFGYSATPGIVEEVREDHSAGTVTIQLLV